MKLKRYDFSKEDEIELYDKLSRLDPKTARSIFERYQDLKEKRNKGGAALAAGAGALTGFKAADAINKLLGNRVSSTVKSGVDVAGLALGAGLGAGVRKFTLDRAPKKISKELDTFEKIMNHDSSNDSFSNII